MTVYLSTAASDVIGPY